MDADEILDRITGDAPLVQPERKDDKPFVDLREGDCREVLKELDDNSVDAVVTDPPYGLEFMGKDWDAPWKTDRRQTFDGTLNDQRENPYGRSRVRNGTGASYGADARIMRFFQEWCETWAVECLRVLKPGGHLLAFGGSRTYHRLASAVEDAGFEIRDQIMWIYASGFPKSSNQTDDWEGWGTALKPAHEPIVVARKPLIGTVPANLAKYGVGALNIDGCRVEADGRPLRVGDYKKTADNVYAGRQDGSLMGGSKAIGETDLGRWPANVIHDGSDEVLAAFPQARGQIADASSSSDRRKTQNVYGTMNRGNDGATVRDEGGSAARFFYAAKSSKADRNDGLDSEAIVSILGAWENADQKVTLRVATGTSRPRVIDVSGASMNIASEWSTLLFGNGRTGQFQTASKSTTKTKISSTIASTICSSLATFATSGCIPVATLMPPGSSGSRAENAELIDLSLTTTSEKMASALGANLAALKTPLRISVFVPIVSSSHPTVKPTTLMQYLTRLVTPPGGVVLDPFMGSGSTGRGAVLEGFSFIGIEMDAAYYDIADARIAAAERKVGR